MAAPGVVGVAERPVARSNLLIEINLKCGDCGPPHCPAFTSFTLLFSPLSERLSSRVPSGHIHKAVWSVLIYWWGRYKDYRTCIHKS